ncbi:TPA: transcriptional regulator [Candidatus Micrarchaeota archaeon]|nr:transcriptional regulator [Candidatus Micrarchaeota archaeon]
MAGEIVTMDKFGRILIPAFLRRHFSSKKFAVREENKEIRLIPVMTWREALGFVKGIDMKKFEKEHHEEWE